MNGSPGLFFHPPGAVSRSGVLDLGRRCAHSCRFCYYSFMSEAAGGQFAALRRAPFRSTEDSLRIIDLLAANGLVNFDITGGEPTMHEGLPDMVRRAAARDLSVRVITLGQFLTARRNGGPLLDRLLDAGVTDFLFSMHAADEDGFHRATGGSLKKLLAAMTALDAAGFQYAANTVIHTGNLADLPRIAALSAAHGVYHHNFIVFNAYYHWDSPAKVAGMQAAYPDIVKPLTQAVDILNAAGIAVTIRYLPLCAAPALARHIVGVVGVHHDPHEWMNRAGNEDREPEYCAAPLPVPVNGPRDIYALKRGDRRIAYGADGSLDTVAVRGQDFKLFPPRCRDCAAMPFCDGLDPKYLLLRGDVHLHPFAAQAARGSEPLLAARRQYLPAYAVKRAPFADMRGAIARVLGRRPLAPQPTVTAVIAPGCRTATAATRAALERQTCQPAAIRTCRAGGSAGAALNDAARADQGTILAFFPAGTTPEPGLLAAAVAFLSERPELSLVRIDGGPEPDFQTLLTGDTVMGTFAVRREAFEATGGFQETLERCLFWDFHLAATAAGHGGGLLPGAGETAALSRVDAGQQEFSRVVSRNRLIFPREVVPHRTSQTGKDDGVL